MKCSTNATQIATSHDPIVHDSEPSNQVAINCRLPDDDVAKCTCYKKEEDEDGEDDNFGFGLLTIDCGQPL